MTHIEILGNKSDLITMYVCAFFNRNNTYLIHQSRDYNKSLVQASHAIKQDCDTYSSLLYAAWSLSEENYRLIMFILELCCAFYQYFIQKIYKVKRTVSPWPSSLAHISNVPSGHVQTNR